MLLFHQAYVLSAQQSLLPSLSIQTIADKLNYTIDASGNDAIPVIYATGMSSTTGNPSARLLNSLIAAVA